MYAIRSYYGFSLFVSEDMKVYACSFQAGLIDGDQLTDQNTLEDIV